MKQPNTSGDVDAAVVRATSIAPPRAMSVDVLRGLVMFTMVFVNDVAGGRGVPWWMKHFPGNKSGMTFVDVVFPAFLFIVGMSIPLAVEGRRQRGDSWLVILGHVLLRTASLLFLGCLMVNDPDDAKIGWPDGLWSALMYGGAIVAFLSLPLRKPLGRYIVYAVRTLAVGLLIVLAVKFRDENGHMLRHEWWGILGLIGWAYLVSTLAYVALRREHLSLLFATAALLMCLFFADRAGTFEHWRVPIGSYVLRPARFVSIGETLGSQASITMLGVALGATLLPTSALRSPMDRVRLAGLMTLMLCVAALLLHQSFGINKNSATPSWCLWSAAITTVLWIVLYGIVDVAGLRFWAIPLAWAGMNALLIYLLHPLWGLLSDKMDWNFWSRYPQAAYRSLLVALGLTLIGGIAGKLGLRLRL